MHQSLCFYAQLDALLSGTMANGAFATKGAPELLDYTTKVPTDTQTTELNKGSTARGNSAVSIHLLGKDEETEMHAVASFASVPIMLLSLQAK